MSYGLVKVIPKDQLGQVVKDMQAQRIDINPQQAGVQEAKEWIAMVEYIRSFAPDAQGIPLIPERYKQGDQSMLLQP